ncbi:MAG: Alpha-amylase/alpha-mannosidase [Methanomicrobiales archaeon 53_19]|jgi:alpha-amylase|uniref:hypothetical protein n=1 Tax=Methanocalculus sp. TaxID=2004547 RepID=UPI00074A1B3F|nr:hypothetical protein [Methanocalculus sp.]KUK71141.1 MAG: Alpha-amylase/alpha-mannosidase [Methanocalculus sp. 52_23]KUL05001.1 MAG: Alpha-amylase/alpha-mannosidase [Methanomicrobiales archaeon 53_19]HIJ05994.1 hypothetical protein [Methanocalculus sp.]
MGFVFRHPAEINPAYVSGSIDTESTPSPFSDRSNRERIRRFSRSSYTPAAETLLGIMDEGFRCSLLLSGMFIELLEQADPDLYSLLSQAATHRNAGLLAETYYHSVIGIFHDAEEYRTQLEMHRSLMQEFSGRTPSIMLATESVFNRTITRVAHDMGFSAIYTDIFGRNAPELNPAGSYQVEGMPVLIRHCELSDDIAYRFGQVDWAYHPLSPQTYAGWVASIGGGTVHIIVDIEVFGGRFSAESGIFRFLEELPAAYADHGVKTVLPSDTIQSSLSPEPVPDELLDRSPVVWPVNMLQCTALDALRAAGRWVFDRRTLRLFQSMDLFESMATTSGSCGMLLNHRTQAEAHEAFTQYLGALSRFEDEQSRKVRSKSAARYLRCVSPDRAFHFCTPYHREGFSAHSLDEFVKLMDLASDECILHHCERSDLYKWIRDVIGDTMLAERIHPLRDRQEIRHVIANRIDQLWNRLK